MARKNTKPGASSNESASSAPAADNGSDQEDPKHTARRMRAAGFSVQESESGDSDAAMKVQKAIFETGRSADEKITFGAIAELVRDGVLSTNL